MKDAIEKSIQILNQLYENTSAFNVSREERDQKGLGNDSSFTYGEILDKSMAAILEMVQPQSGEVFYDLGSGVGKPVLWSSLLYDWKKCCGIEFLKGLYEISVEQSRKLQSNPEIKALLPNKKFFIQFINDSFLNHSFSDANVVFLNATAFSQELWKNLLEKLHTLPQGARVMVLTKSIESDSFELFHSSSYLMSWGENSVRFYRKIK